MRAIATRLFVGMLTPAMRAKVIAPFLRGPVPETPLNSHSPPMPGRLAIPMSLGPASRVPEVKCRGNDSPCERARSIGITLGGVNPAGAQPVTNSCRPSGCRMSPADRVDLAEAVDACGACPWRGSSRSAAPSGGSRPSAAPASTRRCRRRGGRTRSSRICRRRRASRSASSRRGRPRRMWRR